MGYGIFIIFVHLSNVATEDKESFTTPPSTPLPARQAPPIPDVIGTAPGYQLVSKTANISASHLELTIPGAEGKNYIALVSDYYKKASLIAVLLANHVPSQHESSAKCVVVTNTHRQAIQLESDLKQLLPDADITCFTGAKKMSIATKLVQKTPAAVVCTAGKVFSEISSRSVSFKMMSLLIIVDCEYVHYTTSLQDLMHVYVKGICDQMFEHKLPQIIGLTQSPGAGVYALREEEMMDHIVSLCGQLDASHGLLVTNTLRTQVFKQRKLCTEVEVRLLHSRDVTKDCLSLLAVEMGLIEERVGVVCLFEKGTEKYVTSVQVGAVTSRAVRLLPI